MTQRLIAIARKHWATFDGLLASQGLDPMFIPIDRMLNVVYWWATRNATEEADIDKFDRHLWMPPKGVAPPKGSPWSAEAETAAFANVAAAFGVGVTGAAKKGNGPSPA